MRLRLAILVGLVGCESLEPARDDPRPAIELLSPLDDGEVAYNASFRVEAIATAPEGGRLSRVELILRGARSERRTVEASGSSATITVDVALPLPERIGI